MDTPLASSTQAPLVSCNVPHHKQRRTDLLRLNRNLATRVLWLRGSRSRHFFVVHVSTITVDHRERPRPRSSSCCSECPVGIACHWYRSSRICYLRRTTPTRRVAQLKLSNWVLWIGWYLNIRRIRWRLERGWTGRVRGVCLVEWLLVNRKSLGLQLDWICAEMVFW